MLDENLQVVRMRIETALARRCDAKVTGSEVALVAVTKNHPPKIITDIQALGVSDVGENRVQEAQHKQEELGHHGRWHLIGHLQTNKVRHAVECFDIIESVDSEHLLEALNREAEKQNKKLDVLLQINIAREPQKTGFSPEDYAVILPKLNAFSSLCVRGLMCIAPAAENPETIRPVFAEAYKYFVRLKELYADVDLLSMGMSADFEIAVEEGANVVRVGSALFGPRDYNYQF